MAGCFNLEGKNGEVALKMLRDVTDLLDLHGIEYWLEGGTLLGVVRENRLLPWDNDLDISIKEDQYPKLKKVLKKLQYRVRKRRFRSNESPFRKGDVRLVKVRERRFYFFRGEVALDIFVKFEKNDSSFWMIGSRKKSVPAHFYEKIIKYDFAGKKYNVLADYEGYLTYRYGEWRTPVKEWNTFADDNALDNR